MKVEPYNPEGLHPDINSYLQGWFAYHPQSLSGAIIVDGRWLLAYEDGGSGECFSFNPTTGYASFEGTWWRDIHAWSDYAKASIPQDILEFGHNYFTLLS